MSMIYCVEDEEIMCDLMVYTLNNSGFRARGFGDGKELKAEIELISAPGKGTDIRVYF